MGKFRLLETDMKIPCDTFQCHERTAYFLGREDSPKSMLINICQKCADELILDIQKNYTVIEEVAIQDATISNIEAGKISIPFEEPPKEANLEDLTVAELRKLAADEGHEGLSKKTKPELIKLLVN